MSIKQQQYCPKCNKVVGQRAKFCPYCGNSELGMMVSHIDYTPEYYRNLNLCEDIDSAFEKTDGIDFFDETGASESLFLKSKLYNSKVKVLLYNVDGQDCLIIRNYKNSKTKNIQKKQGEIIIPAKCAIDFIELCLKELKKQNKE